MAVSDPQWRLIGIVQITHAEFSMVSTARSMSSITTWLKSLSTLMTSRSAWVSADSVERAIDGGPPAPAGDHRQRSLSPSGPPSAHLGRPVRVPCNTLPNPTAINQCKAHARQDCRYYQNTLYPTLRTTYLLHSNWRWSAFRLARFLPLVILLQSRNVGVSEIKQKD